MRFHRTAGLSFAIASALAVVACPSMPPESAATHAPSPSASTTSSPTISPPRPPSDDEKLQSAVMIYCSAEEDCRHESNTPCMTQRLQMMEAGCVRPMLRYYDCVNGAATCEDGQLSSPECADAEAAMNDCYSGKK